MRRYRVTFPDGSYAYLESELEVTDLTQCDIVAVTPVPPAHIVSVRDSLYDEEELDTRPIYASVRGDYQ